MDPFEFCDALYRAPDGSIVLFNARGRYDYGAIVAWAEANSDRVQPLPAPSPDPTASRVERDRLLSACDFRMLPDAPGDKEAWRAYRQALRDWPEAGNGFPDLSTLPDPPQD